MIEYVNIAAVVWLTLNILMTTVIVNNNIGRKIEGVNITPLVISIAALITLGIAVIKEVM